MNTVKRELISIAQLMSEAAKNKNIATIAVSLSKIRKDQGFTQVEVARKLKTNQSVYSRYERGEIRIPADTLLRLAKILGVTPNDLCGVTDSGGSRKVDVSDDIPKRFLRRLRGVQKLTRTDQDYLLRTIDAFMSVGQEKANKKLA